MRTAMNLLTAASNQAAVKRLKSTPHKINSINFDELLLEAREFLFAYEEWEVEGTHGIREMLQIVHEFEARFQIHFEPEPMSIYGVLL